MVVKLSGHADRVRDGAATRTGTFGDVSPAKPGHSGSPPKSTRKAFFSTNHSTGDESRSAFEGGDSDPSKRGIPSQGEGSERHVASSGRFGKTPPSPSFPFPPPLLLLVIPLPGAALGYSIASLPMAPRQRDPTPVLRHAPRTPPGDSRGLIPRVVLASRANGSPWAVAAPGTTPTAPRTTPASAAPSRADRSARRPSPPNLPARRSPRRATRKPGTGDASVPLSADAPKARASSARGERPSPLGPLQHHRRRSRTAPEPFPNRSRTVSGTGNSQLSQFRGDSGGDYGEGGAQGQGV